MTAFYASYTKDTGTWADPDNSGTTSTATDIVELRMGIAAGYTPTRREVLRALDLFRRWIIKGGLSSAGANLPPPTGPV